MNTLLEDLNLADTPETNGAPASLPPVARPLSALVRPRHQDPNELLEYRFLCRLGTLLLCGPTGTGKSSLAMQMMILWALGRELFGIKPARPLKSLLIQAENDDGDQAEMRDGVFAGLELTAEEREHAGQNIIVAREDERTGVAFLFQAVRPLLAEYKPDLLWLDPMLSFLGGESNSQKDVGGFWVPNEVLTRNFIAGTGTLGGMLVQTDNAADQFIELLRNKSQVMNLGARMLSLTNPVTIPRQNGPGTANWVGKTVAATLSTGNFTQITLTPNGVSAFQQYSKQLLFENNPSIDSLIRDDITQILGLAIDLAALHGTGSGQPTGIVGTTGIGTIALSANGLALANATAYPALVSLETVVSTANADMGALAYLARPSHRGSLRTAQRFASTDSPVFETRMLPNGTFQGSAVGYRAEVTNQLSTILTTGTATTITSCIIFGNWNDLLVANFNGGAVDLVVDPYTLAANAVVRLIARQWIDIAIRHPASFAVLGGIL